ncbi:MAG: hypothetical protein IPL32_01885 [Chloracidobacterium sp.]|nr:hypothetical protein [Chloracidobacterium sp.]
MKPETLSSKNIYKGKIFDIRIDTIWEDDVQYQLEVVVHRSSSVIVPAF